jgi:hypothetical protein
VSHCDLAFADGHDPLGRDIPLDHTLGTTVLGVPMRFESNSQTVIDIAAEAFGEASGATKPWRRRPLTVRVVVYHGDDGADSPVRVWSPDATRLVLHGSDRVAFTDPVRRTAIAYVSCALVARRMVFRQAVLEQLTFGLVDHYDRHPVHAAAIARDGAAVLLFGPSGAGKSTVAYAAHLAGLTVVTDDVVWIQLRPRATVWGPPGRSRRISLMPDARERFPTLTTVEPMILPNGKRKLSIPIEGAVSLRVEHAVVCLITRSRQGTVLSRERPEQIADALCRPIEPGFDRFPARVAACARALAGTGGWRLAISDDVSTAVPHLVAMLDEARRMS